MCSNEVNDAQWVEQGWGEDSTFKEDRSTEHALTRRGITILGSTKEGYAIKPLVHHVSALTDLAVSWLIVLHPRCVFHHSHLGGSLHFFSWTYQCSNAAVRSTDVNKVIITFALYVHFSMFSDFDVLSYQWVEPQNYIKIYRLWVFTCAIEVFWDQTMSKKG